jgi:hypothetical protein
VVPANGACVLRNAEDTFYTTDYTACDTTDGSADSTANRASRSVAYGRSLLGTPNNALSVPPCRQRERGQPKGGHQSVSFHNRAPQSYSEKSKQKTTASSLLIDECPIPTPSRAHLMLGSPSLNWPLKIASSRSSGMFTLQPRTCLK